MIKEIKSQRAYTHVLALIFNNYISSNKYLRTKARLLIMEPSLPGKIMPHRWRSNALKEERKSYTYFMWVNKRGDKKQAHNYYKQHTEPARWRLGGEEKKKKEVITGMSNSLNQEENITPSVFSLGTLQSRSHGYANQKVARRKVQVRGELAEIVSISPTGFASI